MVSTSVLDVAQGGFNPAEEFQKIQARKQAVLRQQEAQQDEMTRYLAGQLDFKNFATGTVADPIINEGLNNIMQKYMMRIKQNKGEGLGGLMMDLSRDVSDFRNLSEYSKQIRQNIENGVKTIGQQNPDVATNRLYHDAMIKAFYKTDPNTGQVSFKSPDELDPNADYTGQSLLNTPENYLDGNAGFLKYLKSLPKQETKFGQDVYVRPGAKVKGEWEASISPFQEIDYEKDGIAKGTRMRGEPIKISNGQQTTEYMGVPKDLYDQFIGTTQGKFYIDAMFNRYNKENGSKINPYSPEADDLKRIMAYNFIKSMNQNDDGFKFKRSENVSPIITKNYYGNNSGGGGKGGSGGGKNPTTNFVLRVKNAMDSKNDAEVNSVIRELFAGNGNNQFVSGGLYDDGKIRINYKEKQSKENPEPQVNTIILDPNDRDMYYKLARVYQDMTGSDAKLETDIYQDKHDYSNQSNKGVKQEKPKKKSIAGF